MGAPAEARARMHAHTNPNTITVYLSRIYLHENGVGTSQ